MTIETDSEPGREAETADERGGKVHPLGHRQRMIWAGQVLDPDVPLYNMAHAFTVNGPIDVDAFRRAFALLVDSHDALRTVIVDDGGRPAQRILEPGGADLDVIDLRDGADPMAAAADWVDDRSRRRFDLSRRLYDSALLLVGHPSPDDPTDSNGSVVWYLNQHHLICDAWSVSVLLDRQGHWYRRVVDGEVESGPGISPEPAPSYLDFLETEAANEGSRGRTRARAHWQERVADQPEPLSFYGPRPDDAGWETARVEARIEGDRARRLERFLARPEVAMLSPELTALRFFHTVLAAYLHRIGGVDRVAVGTPFHNRAKRAQKQTAGLFMHLYPVVTEVAPGETMTSLADKVGTELFESLQHATSPMDAADEGRAFEVVLNYLNIPHETFDGRPVEDRWVHPGAGDRTHSLRWQIRRLDDGFGLLFDVKTAVFDEAARAALVQHILAFVDAWTDDLEIPVAAVPLLSSTERERLVVGFNQRSGPELPTTTVVDQFATVVDERPDQVAVYDGDRVFSYGELDRLVSTIAAELEQRGIAPGASPTYVGVLLGRSVEAVATILAVLRRGVGYLPIEPGTPPARLAAMLADAEVGLICTDGANRATAEAAGADLLQVDSLRPAPASPPPRSERQEPAVALDQPAYLLFTSGSTGRPKGVPIDHLGLANYVAWARRHYTDGQPRSFALYTSLAFDLTITSIFVPLISGGSIVVYGAERADGTPLVVDVFGDDRAEVIKATPSHLAIVAQLGLRASRLRALVIGGEDLTSDLAGTIQDLHPDAVLYNEYGPTETVVGCMVHRFDPATDRHRSVPIGRPAANAEILVLDRAGYPVPPGVVGEIHIGGPGVAGRYLARPELSAERFVPRPEHLPPTEAGEPAAPGPSGPLLYRTGDLARWRQGDGAPQLEFLGRADDQVKLRGHRIELGEIEAALGQQAGVDAAAVVVVSESVGPGTQSRDQAGDREPIAAEQPLIHCARCGLPSNYPDATFEDGVCSICRDYDTYRHKVEAYFATPGELGRIAQRLRADRAGERYDCLVLLSGGKDSTYMLYQVVALGLRPLVFTLDNGFISPSALANCRRVCADLGVDLEIGRTEHMNEIFRDSLERFSNVCNGCFKTIYTLSMNLARSNGIDHIVTGLARGQLFETRLSDMYDHRIFDVDQIDRFVLEARKAYHQIDDAVSELLDVSAFVDGRIYDEITFVDFYRYVDVGLDEVLAFLDQHTPWIRPPDTGRSTNCLINDVGIHVHQRERGFHNYALPYSWDVRLGHKQRDAAMDELDDDIDLDYVNEVMVEIGYEPRPPVASHRSDRLVAHYQSPEPRPPHELRDGLAALLPPYMLPTSFVHHPQLPLTVNGKVDRARLVELRSDNRTVGAPGLDELTEEERTRAETLCTVWASIFDRPVAADDNFFELGGDSIIAIQIVDRAAANGVAVTPRQLFDAQTPTATALVARAAEPVGAVDGGPVGPAGPREAGGASEVAGGVVDRSPPADELPTTLPLTSTQAGMLFHTLAEPEAGLYQGQIVHHLRGRIDVATLRSCWDDLVDRHETLRTVFRWEGRDHPVQEPGTIRPELVHHDWRAAPDGEARLERLLVADRADRFDLAAAPPVRLVLAETVAGPVLIWSFHHIAFDGWSIALAVNELLDSYQARLDGRPWEAPERLPFARYHRWLDQQDQAAAERFWRAELAGLDGPTPLPGEAPPPPEPRPTVRPYGAVERRVARDHTRAVTDWAGQTRVTLGTVLQGVWALVLARHQGPVPVSEPDDEPPVTDVVFGVTTSGRPADLPGADTMAGMLVTTLPTRVPVDPGADPERWLRSIQDRQLQIRDHEYASLVDIQRWSGLGAAQPLFESILVVENFPDYQAPADPEALAVESRAYRVQSNYAISLIVLPGPELTLKAVYDPDRLPVDSVERLLEQVETALASLATGQVGTVGEVATVPVDEHERLVRLADGPAMAAAPELVTGLIADRVRSTPDAVAVVCGRDRLSYRQLGERADEVAEVLREAGAGPGRTVAILAERSVELVTAIVAVHRAGAAYLPLDPDYPADRVRFTVDDAEVVAVLSTAPARAAVGQEVSDLVAPDTGDGPIGQSGLSVRSRTTSRPIPSDRPVEAEDPAYLIYTSGSTGRPNGVLVDHGNLAWSTAARDQAYRRPPDAFLLLSSFAFDSSVVGLFWTLSSGGTLVLPGPGEELDVRILAGLIERWEVTHTLSLPSLYRLLLEHAPHRALVTLDTVIVAGEACPPEVVTAHVRSLPGVELHNEYGPTEASVWCTVHRCDPAIERHPVGADRAPVDVGARTDRSVPIGHPAPGSTVAVVDRQGRPAGIGVPGEIWVTGPGLTGGYHRRPELTARRFVEHDGRRWFRTGDVGTVGEDGALRFRGRIDDQVKIRGHRIELGEVEAALAAHPAVAEAVALALADPTGARLVAHAQIDGGTGPRPSPVELQAWVAERLPDAFVPSAVAAVDELPRLPNGKVDRRRLGPISPVSSGNDRRVPRTTIERNIAAIWADLLPGVEFGTDDDFFDLGGHSLLAVSLVERIRTSTGVDLPLSALLQTPTIAALAQRLAPDVRPEADDGDPGRPRVSAPASSLVALREGGGRVPLYLIPPAAGTALSFRELAAGADPDQPLWCFEPVGTYGEAEPHDTVEAMAEHYLAELRAAQPDGRYRIGGSCLGAIVAWEMAARLDAEGTPVELLVFLDPGPPHSGPGWSYELPSQRSPGELLRTSWSVLTGGNLVEVVRAVWRRNTFDRIGRIHYRAQLRYVADRLTAPILWLESEELDRTRPDFLRQWRILAGDDLTPIVVPDTTHDGLMTGQPREVRRLVVRFNEAMARFDRTGELPRP